MKESQFTISTEVLPGSTIVTNGLAGTVNDAGEFDGYRVRMLWDTGSSRSAISEKVASRLPLEYLRHHEVDTAHEETISLPLYGGLCMMIAEGLTLQPKAVDVMNLKGKDIDAIIGMDIISMGKFVLEPTDGGVRFTFSI